MDYNELFEILVDEKKIKCLTCGKLLSGTNIFNAKRHYALCHKIDISKARTPGECKTPARKSHDYININIDKAEFLRCCVGLVTMKNLPFRLFDDKEFFKALLEPYERKFGVVVNSHNLTHIIGDSSKNITDTIASRLKHKLISLKLDTASRMGKSVLAINVQYMQDFKICTHTLGIIRLQRKHKVKDINEELFNCLDAYGLGLQQVYSNTVDNGANLNKSSKILLDETRICEESEIGVEEQEDLQNAIVSVLSVERCAAHMLQLAAYDVLKTLTSTLEECRILIKEVRTLVDAESSNAQMLVLDNSKSWYSTYEMITMLQESQEVIEQQCTDMDEFDWQFVSNFIKAFQPLAQCTKRMQSEQYIFGDFYRDWLSCELELSDLGASIPYAAQLHAAMTTRKQILMENDAFIAALYLDPRFNFQGSMMLSAQQKISAENHLIKTYENMLRLQISLSGQNQYQQHTDSLPSTSSNTFSRLERHICKEMIMETKNEVEEVQNLRQKLNAFSCGRKLSLDTDILCYWKTYSLDKELRKLAEVVLAVPVTQVSVEHAFSALSVISTKNRAKLNDATINNLVITNLNFDLWHFRENELNSVSSHCN
ncbi:uncharacterized protein LOC105214818 [Zeugodacus cucurbitae]|uniref:uncharacterized protein LOC105214818 n=1 Tax=Zeugodacus cucurbitae TaxID=28588 RepID=UPI0023D90EC2|nr:uncharacterized protein LOC105214818 [Zeugodacus cucurbitae]